MWEKITTDIRYLEEESYGFVSGRIRVREKFFLNKEKYESLLNCETPERFVLSLADTPYAQFKEKSLLEIIRAAEWENHSFLKEYANQKILPLLLFPFDLHNIKLFRKGEILSQDLSLYSSPFGYFPYGDFPLEIKAMMKEATSDDDLEVRFFSYIYSQSAPFPFLAEYLSFLSDVKNILALLRVIKFRLTDYLFLSHSHLGSDFFRDLLKEAISSSNLSGILGKFPSPYQEILREVGPFLFEGNLGFLRLERRLGSFISLFLRSVRYLPYGYEVLAAYYLLKRQEIENIHRIYLSRFQYNITDSAILREMVII